VFRASDLSVEVIRGDTCAHDQQLTIITQTGDYISLEPEELLLPLMRV
jgi:hypothetical protein